VCLDHAETALSQELTLDSQCRDVVVDDQNRARTRRHTECHAKHRCIRRSQDFNEPMKLPRGMRTIVEVVPKLGVKPGIPALRIGGVATYDRPR
jgi:hypothetical protein